MHQLLGPGGGLLQGAELGEEELEIGHGYWAKN